MPTYLDFEKPIAELDNRLHEAQAAVAAGRARAAAEVSRLQARLERAIAQTHRKLTPWQRVQLARHPDRPTPTDYARGLSEAAIPLGGAGNEAETFTALARLRGFSAIVIAVDQVGLTPPVPLLRLAALAERWRLPLVRFVATGEGAAAAIDPAAAAEEVRTLLTLSAVLVTVIVGAVNGFHPLAVAASDHVLMMDYAVWSVVTPEAAAADLWQDPDQHRSAAETLRLTAADNRELGLVDVVIAEPQGGAHRAPATAISLVGDALALALGGLVDMPPGALRRRRIERLRQGGFAGAPR